MGTRHNSQNRELVPEEFSGINAFLATILATAIGRKSLQRMVIPENGDDSRVRGRGGCAKSLESFPKTLADAAS